MAVVALYEMKTADVDADCHFGTKALVQLQIF